MGKKLPELDAKYQVFFHFVSWVEFIIGLHPPSWKRMTCPSRIELLVDLNTMMQRTANKAAAGLRRICKRSDQPSALIERKVTMIQGWYYLGVESLTEQRHGSPDRKPRIAILDSFFNLVESRHHGVASNEVISWSADHPLNADGDDLRWNSNPTFCRLVNVTHKTW